VGSGAVHPFDVDDVNIITRSSRAEPFRRGEHGRVLVAREEDKINDYTTVLTNAGKAAQVVDVDVFALQNAYEVNYDVPRTRSSADQTSGRRSRHRAILQSGILDLLARYLDRRQPLHEAIQKDLNVPFDQPSSSRRGRASRGAKSGACGLGSPGAVG